MPTTSVRLATAPLAVNPIDVIVISDDESPTSASFSTSNKGKTATNPVIVIWDSDSEYDMSDIELTDELITQLDHPIPMRRSSPIVITDSEDE